MVLGILHIPTAILVLACLLFADMKARSSDRKHPVKPL